MLFNRVKLYIDEEMVGSGRMPAGATTIDDMKGDAGGLYVGGVPEEGDFENTAATLEPFRGCIMDLLINGTLVKHMGMAHKCNTFLNVVSHNVK
jgi:laminin, alpha 1/2